MNKYTKYTFKEIDDLLNNLSLMKNSFILLGTDVEKQRELLMNAKQQKILKTYPIRIWQAADGTWKAHVPDDKKDRNTRCLCSFNNYLYCSICIAYSLQYATIESRFKEGCKCLKKYLQLPFVACFVFCFVVVVTNMPN